jgi:cyclophilin family peptidyl-prolyl cis-trans isomerase
MNRTPQNRRARRVVPSQTGYGSGLFRLPGILGVLTNPRVFAVILVGMVIAIIASLFVGAIAPTQSGDDNAPVRQANELADVPRDTPTDASAATPVPGGATPVAKRYTAPPPVSIDTSKRYTATISTPKGTLQLELYPDQAPEAVNAFIFLAREGYYDGSPFLQLGLDKDGSRFTAQAGDPTGTGYGTPGFSVRKEQTTKPFARGAVGMGGTSASSNGHQFFISYKDHPELNGKYTIFGQITSGLDVLDRLTLGDPTQGDVASSDEITSIVVTES